MTAGTTTLLGGYNQGLLYAHRQCQWPYICYPQRLQEAGVMISTFAPGKKKKSPKDSQLDSEGASTKPGWVSKAHFPLCCHASCSSFICPHHPSLPSPRPLRHFPAPSPAPGLSVFQSSLKVAARIIFLKNCLCVAFLL